MATAKKLPSGNWRVQAAKVINGKKEKKSFTAKTKKEAELLALNWQNQQTALNDISSLTLYDAYEQYISLKEKVLSPSTIKGYRSMQKNTFKNIMHMRIQDLTVQLIQKEISLLSASHSPKYQRNAYGLFTAVTGMFSDRKFLGVTLSPKKQTDLYIPDDNEISVLLKEAKGTRLEIPILLAAFGPMRRGEICALTSEDIKGNVVSVNKSLVMNKNNEWEIKAPKTFSSYRNILYPDFVINTIKKKEGKICDMTPSAITDAFGKLLKKAGLPHFRFHDLRHYAVSTLHAQNIPDKYIQARGGWQTNHVMQNVYNHTIKNIADETDQKILNHFAKIHG